MSPTRKCVDCRGAGYFLRAIGEDVEELSECAACGGAGCVANVAAPGLALAVTESVVYCAHGRPGGALCPHCLGINGSAL